MPEQLPLRYNDRWHDEQAWQEVLGEIRTVVAHLRPQQVGYDLDIQPSVLSKALTESDRHRVAAEWLVYLIRKAPDDRIVELLARLRGLDVHRPEPLTDQQWRAKMQAALDAFPETVRRALMEQAFGPGAKP